VRELGPKAVGHPGGHRNGGSEHVEEARTADRDNVEACTMLSPLEEVDVEKEGLGLGVVCGSERRGGIRPKIDRETNRGGCEGVSPPKIPCTDGLHKYSKLNSFVITQIVLVRAPLVTETFDVELHAGFLIASASWTMCTMGGKLGVFFPGLELEGRTLGHIFISHGGLFSIAMRASVTVLRSAAVTASNTTGGGDDSDRGMALGSLWFENIEKHDVERETDNTSLHM
jgi:hypothetical protein